MIGSEQHRQFLSFLAGKKVLEGIFVEVYIRQ